MFNPNLDKESRQEIKQIRNYLTKHPKLCNKNAIADLNNVINGKENLFCNIDVLKNIIEIASLCSHNTLNVNYLNIASKLYNLNVSAIPDEAELKNFYNIYKLILNLKFCDESKVMFINGLHIYTIIYYLNYIYDVFKNKNLVKVIFSEVNTLKLDEKFSKKVIYLKEYISQSKMYYNDEYVYISSIHNFFSNLCHSSFNICDTEMVAHLINKQLLNDERLAGFYDVSEEKVESLEKKVIELETKLTAMQNTADSNSNTYNKIKLEAQEILENLSNIKKGGTRKVFKIMNINETIERQLLLQKIKVYNSKFRLQTLDTNWFRREVVDKLGIEYIANTDLNKQKSILIAYQQNQIDAFAQILKINSDFKLYSANWFNCKNIELFGINLIATSLNSQAIQSLADRLQTNDEFDLLKDIMNINPNFKIYYITDYINKEVANNLSIEYMANSNSYQQGTMLNFYDSKEMSKLYGILKINPNFCIDTNLIYKDFNLESTFLNSEIEALIKNFSIGELIEFFVDNSNIYRLHKLFNIINFIDDKSPSEKRQEFINLKPEYRKKVLEINVDKLNPAKVAKLFNKIVKDNATNSATNLKVKKLFKSR